MRKIFRCLALALMLGAPLRISDALAQPLTTQPLTAQPLTETTSGTIIFDAPTYANFGSFRKSESTPGKAAVTIWLPKPEAAAKTERDGKLAAVMIAHSIGGWSEDAEGLYVRPLLDAGYAVLGLDHFGPRGIARAADVPGAISTITPVSDALLALKLAATHPRIDARRVGIMGLSMGGITAELTSYTSIRRKMLGEAAPHFAAHVTFYAPCGNFFSSDIGPLTDGAPMLKLYAGHDETTPRAKCERVEILARAAEPDLNWQVHWYPDAFHAWENARLSPPRFRTAFVNTRKCPVLDFGARLRFIDADGSERPFDAKELARCLKDSSGYTLGYSPAAAQDAMQRMLAFFDRTLNGR